MTVGSCFAGIGGFEYALEPVGFDLRWRVEIDPICNAVSRRHFPDATYHEDMHDVGAHNLDPVDLICGGSPCQSVSVAGSRAGFAGESGLFREFARVVGELRPTWIFFENVPGLLSSWTPVEPPPSDLPEGAEWETDETSDFGAVLSAFTDLGYCCAWRILDAEYDGLAQRRRRVFVVGRLGGPIDRVAEVLLEPQSLCGDPPPRRSSGQDAAPHAKDSAGRCGGGADDNAPRDNHVVAQAYGGNGQDPADAATTLRSRDAKCSPDSDCTETLIVEPAQGLTFEPRYYLRDNKTGGAPDVVTGPLRSGDHIGDSTPHVLAYGGNNTTGPIDVATCCNAKGGTGRIDFESETFVVHERLAPFYFEPRVGRNGRGAPSEVVAPLKAENGQTGKGDGTPCVAVPPAEPLAFHAKQDPISGPVSPALGGSSGGSVAACVKPSPTVDVLPFDTTQITSPGNYSHPKIGGPCHPLSATAHPPTVAIGAPQQRWIVRRLTPTEWCRLQGLPDDYVRFTADGKPVSDAAQYRMLGNGVAIPTIRWIGHRIACAEALIQLARLGFSPEVNSA